MKNNFIYYAALLLLCLTGIAKNAGAQCSALSPTTLSMCATKNATITTTGNALESWSTSASSVATVVRIGAVGLGQARVTGVSAGTSVISYSINGTYCNSATVTVGSLTTPTITSSSHICLTASVTPTAIPSGGTWVSDDPTIVKFTSGGAPMIGKAVGTTTITYRYPNPCGTVTTTTLVMTVDPTITAISGSHTVCAGLTTTLSDAVPGGSWSSTNTGVGTVDATTGVVTGISAGTTTISYTGCGGAGYTFTVLPLADPGTISGPANVCISGTINLTASGTGGGAWSSSAGSVATVSGGVVTGVSPGTTTISYAVTNSCGTQTATYVVTVDPNVAAISGPTSVCEGLTITLSDPVTGGTWASGSPSVGTIDLSTGVFTGILAGTSVVVYTGCGSTNYTITVLPQPNPGVISGISVICGGGATSSLAASGTGGGTWTSTDPSIISVDPATGVATGLLVGITTISYSVTNSCGTIPALYSMTVDPYVAPIAGPTALCVGSVNSITLTSATAGGMWGSSGVNATVLGGVVTGVNAGTEVITYTHGATLCSNPGNIQTYTVTVGAPNAQIPATSALVCAGQSITLTGLEAGGTWQCSPFVTGTIDATTGVYAGITTGTATITYKVTNACAGSPFTATVVVTVDPTITIAPITGPTSLICVGNLTSLTDATPGGGWTTSNPAVAAVGGLGQINGVGPGTATISYTVTRACGSASVTYSLEVDGNTAMIFGPPALCITTTTVTLGGFSPGGTWTSSNTGVATINATTGLVTPVSAGLTQITYIVTNSCGALPQSTMRPLTIEAAAPTAGTITGSAGTICFYPDLQLSLTGASPGGTWSTNDPMDAYVDPTGKVSLIPGGPAFTTLTVTYAVSNSCGSDEDHVVLTLAAQPANPGPISGSTNTLCNTGATINTLLTNGTPGGAWGSLDPSVATIAGGLVTAVNPGTTTITYEVTNLSGCSTYASTVIAVDVLPTFYTAGLSVPTSVSSPGVGSTFTLSYSGGPSYASIAWVDYPPQVTAASSLSSSPVLMDYNTNIGSSGYNFNVTITYSDGCQDIQFFNILFLP